MYTYQEILTFFDSLGKYGAHPGIENAGNLLTLLGHPEETLSFVHVAGTNGKGSVCAFLADIMTACGYRTGLFISPHLVDIRERIQLDRQMIPHDSFVNCFCRVKQAADTLAASGYTGITYFDYLFAMAICYYADMHADVVIVETGLGGRLDSTNTLAHPLLTVITSVSLDHTEVLGDTLTKIAAEKAGIIKEHVPLLFCADEPEVCEVLRHTSALHRAACFGVSRSDCHLADCKEQGKLTFTYHPDMSQKTEAGPLLRAVDSLNAPVTLTVNSPAVYQMENSTLAFLSAQYLLTVLPPSSSTADSAGDYTRICLNALSRSCWEGRFEQIAPNVYLDGAHNADGIRMLLSSLRGVAKGRPVSLLFTAVKEKDTHEMIREICESGLFHRYILTTIDGPRAISPEALKEQFSQYTDAPITTYPTPGAAWDALKNKKDDELLLIAGSLYLVGLIKELLF